MRSELFTSQPKARDLARRRRVTLTVSLAAHVLFGSLVLWLALRPAAAARVEEPTVIPAFFVSAPPAAKAASSQTQSAAATPEPRPAPVPTQTSTQSAIEPIPSTPLPVSQTSGDALNGLVGGAGAINGTDLGAPPSSQPVRIGGNIKAPALVRKVPPSYPKTAQQAHVEGAVVLEAEVTKAGTVDSVRVVKSVAMLDDAAIAAVKQWRYSPLVLNGAAVPFILMVTVTFDLA